MTDDDHDVSATSRSALRLHIYDRIVEARDAHPRSPSDVDSWELADLALAAMAAELREQADGLDECRELLRESTPFADGERDAWEGTARTLRRRADELDPPA